MESLQFKTNIKCFGCVSTVTPFLNKAVGENNWQVDTQNPDKVLTVSGQDVSPETITKAVEEAGYKAQPLN